MGTFIDNSLIIDEIKSYLGFEKDIQLSDFLGIKRNTLSNWRARNMLDYQLLLTKCDWIDANYLFTMQGSLVKKTTVTEAQDLDILINFEHRVPQVVTIDGNQKDNVVMVPVKARAGYLDGFYRPEFIQTLPTYRLPNINNGTFRMFEVKGHSMNQSLPNKSIAVGEWVENWIDDIKDGRIYIIVYDDGDKFEDGIIIKRCLNRIKKYNNLICKSDNLDRSSYPNISIDPMHIKEVWELKGAFKFEFPDPSSLFKRMDDLEANYQQLFDIIRQNKLER